jgi:hypothetical protein
MARIESLGEFFHFTNPRGKSLRRKGRATEGGFAALVSASTEQATDILGADDADGRDIEDLLDEVHSAGDALKKRPNGQTIQGYRSAVQAFLRHVMGRVFDTERHRSRPNVRQGTQKQYLLVRTVDEKLERLVVDVLQSQVEQLDLLERIEEINGLLVDLTG